MIAQVRYQVGSRNNGPLDPSTGHNQSSSWSIAYCPLVPCFVNPPHRIVHYALHGNDRAPSFPHGHRPLANGEGMSIIRRVCPSFLTAISDNHRKIEVLTACASSRGRGNRRCLSLSSEKAARNSHDGIAVRYRSHPGPYQPRGVDSNLSQSFGISTPLL